MPNYRLFFNRHAEAPQVWSVDEGDQASEINVKGYALHRCSAESRYDGSVRPNKDTPTAWLEVINVVMEIRDGIANFFHDPNWRLPRIPAPKG